MNNAPPTTEADLWQALAQVPDPELPQISLVELGVILRVELDSLANHARILLMPTFLGCPALEQMRAQIASQLLADYPHLAVEVVVTREHLWSSDRISTSGRQKLAAAGIAPPGPAQATLLLFEAAPCPHCGSRNTSLDSIFGPTLCRAISHCRTCRQPFEQFKPV